MYFQTISASQSPHLTHQAISLTLPFVYAMIRSPISIYQKKPEAIQYTPSNVSPLHSTVYTRSSAIPAQTARLSTADSNPLLDLSLLPTGFATPNSAETNSQPLFLLSGSLPSTALTALSSPWLLSPAFPKHEDLLFAAPQPSLSLLAPSATKQSSLLSA